MSGGLKHSLAVANDGAVWAWGGAEYGQLGDGARIGRLLPTRAGASVAAFTGLGAIAAGYGQSFAWSPTTLAPPRQTSTYTYDRLSRLTGVQVLLGASSTTTTYGYDPLGNRATLTRGGTTTAYAYDRADRLVQAGAQGVAVDAVGNTTARGTDTFAYDQANGLTSATVGGVTTTFTYDGDGKRFSSTTGCVTTRSVYDVAGGLPRLVDDGQRKYVWGAAGLAYSDGPAGFEVPLMDGLGSVRALTDSAARVVQTYRTDAFGVPLQALGPSG